MRERGWKAYQREWTRNRKPRYPSGWWRQGRGNRGKNKGRPSVYTFFVLGSFLIFWGWFSVHGTWVESAREKKVSKPKKIVVKAGPREGIKMGPLYIQEGSVRFEDSFRPDFRTVRDGRFVTDLPEGLRVTYSLNVQLQKQMERTMARYRLPYGMLVAMDPRTGRLLAMAEYSHSRSIDGNLNLRASYPAASIFKLVTAGAALDRKRVDPDTVIAFRGGLWKLGPWNWKDNPARDRRKISLTAALGKSCNVAFAKVALRWLGEEGLSCYADSFWFNKPIPFEFPVEVSRASIEDTESSIAYTAAGLGEVRLSPIHGALIASAIANGGVMMEPRLVEAVTGPDGEEIYRAGAHVLTHVVTPETAAQLREMMAYTITKGTSRRAFHSRRGNAYLKGVSIGGKTGSLRGKDPKGKYSWFVGMAPLEDPEIAIAAVVVNKPIWHIKSSHLAKEAFEVYFRNVDSSGVGLKRS